LGLFFPLLPALGSSEIEIGIERPAATALWGLAGGPSFQKENNPVKAFFFLPACFYRKKTEKTGRRARLGKMLIFTGQFLISRAL